MLELNGVFYTVSELSERWGCAVVTVNYYIKKGALKATKLGNKHFVRKEDVDAFTQTLLQTPRAQFIKRAGIATEL